MDQWKNTVYILEFHSTDMFSRTHTFLNIGASRTGKPANSEKHKHKHSDISIPSLKKQSNWDKNIFFNYPYSSPSIF
jgi:hypothetical protein